MIFTHIFGVFRIKKNNDEHIGKVLFEEIFVRFHTIEI
jgi:hypothetical protein